MAGATTSSSSARALRGRRDKVIVATKFGQTKDAAGKRASTAAGIRQAGLRSEPEAPRIDVIDLYYQHRVDPNTRSRRPLAR